MILLPTNLAKLADLTDARSARFSPAAVRLRIHEDNTFTAEATDAKVLLRVTGTGGDPEGYPEISGFGDARDGSPEALIPGRVWRDVNTRAAKLTARVRSPLQALAVRVGPYEAAFAATDGERTLRESTAMVDSNYPPTDAILDSARTSARLAFAADPKLLADFLRVLVSLDAAGPTRVEFHTTGPEKPVYVTAPGIATMRVEGLFMPLRGGAPIPEEPDEAAQLRETVAERDAEIVRLRAQLAAPTPAPDGLCTCPK